MRRRARAGAPFLPYLITDRVVAPEACRKCYSENLALMPHCYFVNDYKRAHMVRRLPRWTTRAHGSVCAAGAGEEASSVCFAAHTQPRGVPELLRWRDVRVHASMMSLRWLSRSMHVLYMDSLPQRTKPAAAGNDKLCVFKA